jgi:hypothetical protein
MASCATQEGSFGGLVAKLDKNLVVSFLYGTQTLSTRGSLQSSDGVAALWPAGGRKGALGGQGGALA